ncbi:hypothetical protein J40TS1_08690 [Paenibacillus montaniterrae]|uniref:Pullulanase n=1 Tax=Paenibacillus montaniterrae TaxID=429341 RepID=A0A919YIZ0_9BACL|nr:DUF6509 family protein [Paenibacillus montaniterrae]GIP15227.1 hypothetical protein J40TS1_08690 [Paenibacillus montaniterrae]
MFTIKEYTVETVADPFKILSGERFEFLIDLEVEEDDELHHEAGVKLRVIYAVENGAGRIVKYEFLTADTGKYIDIEMEDDELAMVAQFCDENYGQA